MSKFIKGLILAAVVVGTILVWACQDEPQEATRIECIKSVRDANRPIERFFLGIRPGDTPENNQHAKLVMDWIKEFEKLIA